VAAVRSNTIPALIGRQPAEIRASTENYPVFLRTRSVAGTVDPLEVGELMQQLPLLEVPQLLARMTTELSFWAGLVAAKSVADLENVIAKNLPIQTVTIWVRADNSWFLFSPTTSQVVPIERSILGKCLDSQKVIITGDPSHHAAFNFDYDLVILRGAVSMVLLPVISDLGDQLAVIECVNLVDSERGIIIPFSKYAIRALKIAHGRVKTVLNYDFDRKVMEVEGGVSELLSKFRPTEKVSHAAGNVCQYLTKLLDCAAANVYSYSERSRSVTDLRTEMIYEDAAGGIAYTAAVKGDPIMLAHSLLPSEKVSEIDHQHERFSSRSIIFG
jgi:hypothetical protein